MVYDRGMTRHSALALLLAAAACGDDTGGGATGSGGGATSSAVTGTSSTPASSGSDSGAGGGPGAGGDDATSGTGASGAGEPGSGGGTSDLVPVFVAQGHLGRTTISCDDGRTWIRERSAEPDARCYDQATGNRDCDHDENAARGIAWGEGTFVLTWGWGHPSTVVRSTDLETWDTVLTESGSFADVAFGNGRFIANDGQTMVSDDLGVSWTQGGTLDIGMNTRSIDFLPFGDGVFVVTGESGDARSIVTSADGSTWSPAATRPDECLSYYRGAAFGAGAIVLASGNGHVCVSRDGGAAWEVVDVTDGFGSNIVFTGGAFIVYGGGKQWRSEDGTSWDGADVTPPGTPIGNFAVSDDGTFAAANDGWQVWYENQHFYRSADGIDWEVLPAGSFTGSHPIYFMSFGHVAPSAGCGL